MENNCKVIFFNVMITFVIELTWLFQENVDFQNNKKSKLEKRFLLFKIIWTQRSVACKIDIPFSLTDKKL